MNYRHAFHAGNMADCIKHALLVRLVRLLARKPAPFSVLDTHAGLGRYTLETGPATRTGEWRAGIARLLENTPPALDEYVGLVRGLEPGLEPAGPDRLASYPGSPALIRALLRPDDRLACCELHPDDVTVLRRHFARDKQVAVHHRDGYAALTALLPPAPRRGLVLIDPPFEQPDEFARLAEGLAVAQARFRGGVLAAWYPVKGRAGPRGFHEAIRARGLRDVIAAELWLREPTNAARLNGCGLLICNPPFGFEQQAAPILAALLDRLGVREAGEGSVILRVADE